MNLRLGLFLVFLAVPALAGDLTIPSVDRTTGVSPGEVHAPSVIDEACPTFTWAGVADAKAYEFVLFRTTDRMSVSTVQQGVPSLYDTKVPMLVDVVIPAPATSWTPGAPDCLEPGETYAWFVREQGVYGRADGAWSDGRMFEVDPWAAAGPVALANPGNGTGGIPAVLQQLDEIQAQMAEDRGVLEALVINQMTDLQAALDARFAELTLLVETRADSFDTQLGVLAGTPLPSSITGRLEEIKQTLFPCTKEKLANGECEKNNPLDLEITICGTLDAKAALKATYSAGAKTVIKGGARWDIGVLGAAELQGDYSGLLLGPGIPLPLPRLALSGQGQAGLVVKVCLPGIRVPLPGDLRASDRDNLLAAMQGPVDEFLTTANRIVGNLDLNPSRLKEALEGLEALQDAQTIITDPLVFFEAGGPLRELADSLPVGDRAQEFLGHPERLVPSVPESCEDVFPDNLGSDFGDAVDDFCTVIDPLADGFIETIETIESGVETIEGLVNDIINVLP